MSHLELYQVSGLPSNNFESGLSSPCRLSGGGSADSDTAKVRYLAFEASLSLTGRFASDSQIAEIEKRFDAPLVNRCISQTFPVEQIQVYPSAVKLCRQKYNAEPMETAPPLRGEILGFSEQSRRKLRFLVGNTSTRLISQFCLTYHNSNPDGATVKKHLNAWLTNLRKNYSGVAYLWILEFQSRGVPHFHVWLSLPVESKLHSYLANSWNRIADPGSNEHLRFHLHKRNFIEWDMYSSSYLTKYLDKEYQKAVPVGFVGCGRFWGNSRALLAIPEVLTASDLEYLEDCDNNTGEIREPLTMIVRTLGKHHERKLKNTPWHSRVRKGITTVTLNQSAKPLRQILRYMQARHESSSGLPF